MTDIDRRAASAVFSTLQDGDTAAWNAATQSWDGALGKTFDMSALLVAAAGNLALRSGAALILQPQTAYRIRVEIIAVTTDGSAVGHAEHVLEVTTPITGSPTIGEDLPIVVAKTLAAAGSGWSATISAQTGLELRINCNPGTDAVLFTARISMVTSSYFTPDALSGLLLWNKNASLSAGAIATWADSSGGGHTTTVVGSPTVAADAQYGGLLSVPFNGTTQSMLTASLTLGKYTMIQVSRIISGDGFLEHRSDGTNIDYTYKTTGNTIQCNRAAGNSSKNLSANWAFSAAPRTFVTIFDGTHAGHGLRINGVAQTLADGSNVADPGAVTSAQQIDMLGGLAATCGEFLIYNRPLLLTELVKVESYLRSKLRHY